MENNFQICVISSNRWNDIPDFYKKDWVYFVGNGQGTKYQEKGFTNVIESGGLCESRNAALEYCFAQNKYCVQIDDDLKKIQAFGKDFTVKDTVELLMRDLIESKTKLAGVYPVFNKFFASNTISDGFIIGSFFIAAPSPIRFDNTLRLKEDYDYTMLHLKEFGKVRRHNYIIADFKHYTNKGGAVDYRNDEVEAETTRILLRRWNGALKPNPNRKNELILRKDWKKFI